MSIARLSSGKFLVIDTIPLTEQIKAEIDELTENGSKIEAVVATHPFHTLAFTAFHEAYPSVPYYGTPRHLRKLTNIQWAGDLNECSTRNKWRPDIEMSIPEGI
jgi:glyoxylase-like metal-dependent hydrolase (beta-lactamase superfamily II)